MKHHFLKALRSTVCFLIVMTMLVTCMSGLVFATEQVETLDDAVNLSEGILVTSNSTWSDGNWEIVNLTDGSVLAPWPLPEGETLGWRSGAWETREVNITLDIDLMQYAMIERVELYPRGGGATFPDDYSVAVSTDKVEWKTVANVTGDSAIKNEGRILSFEPTEARYVQINITKLSAEEDGGKVCTLSEIKVFGKLLPTSVVNLSKGIQVDPSSSWDDPEGYWRSAFLTDGSVLTPWPLPAGHTLGWRSGSSETKDVNITLDLDLEKTAMVEQVELYPRGGGQLFPDDYSVSVSKDNAEWKTVATVTGDTEIKNEARIFSFEPTEARYIKVTITKLPEETDGGFNVCTLSEITVLGTVIVEEEPAPEPTETYVYVNSLDGEILYNESVDLEEVDDAMLAKLDAYANGEYNKFVKFEEISCKEGVHTFYSVHNTEADVTVTGGNKEDKDYYSILTATVPEGQYFAGWYDGDTLISYESTYKFFPDGEAESITAKYTATAPVKESKVQVEPKRETDKLTVKVTPVDGDKTIVNFGYYIATSAYAMDADAVKAADRKQESKAPHAYMVRVYDILETTKGQNIYIVGYYTYVDGNGDTQTEYTDLITVAPLLPADESPDYGTGDAL